MPVSYTWTLAEDPPTGTVIDPGPYVAQDPIFGTDARKRQFERGIKFANVPDGRADFVNHGGPRVRHINSASNVLQKPTDVFEKTNEYSGALKFRFRSYRSVPVPASVTGVDYRSSDAFANPYSKYTAP